MVSSVESSILPAFCIAGISICTTNQNGQAQKDIGDLWQRWMSEGLAAKLPGRLSEDIYSVYTGYESDHTGAYMVILGCAVPPETVEPEGFTLVSLPTAKYEVNLIEGEMPAAIMQAWQQIWGTATGRKYTFDFEVYSDGHPVKIYLAIA